MELVTDMKINKRGKLLHKYKLPFIVFSFIIICLGLFTFKDYLKNYLIDSNYRPAIGNDFGKLKIIYIDLFNYNSNSYHIAGTSEFPIDSDTNYPIGKQSIEELTEKIRLETLLTLAYSQKNDNLPTKSKTLTVKTNDWQQILNKHEKIKSILLKSKTKVSLNNVNIELSENLPDVDINETVPAKAVRLFKYFLTLRRNGDSPVGDDFGISFNEFNTIYGYGQCSNQSFALADLFQKNGINVRIVQLSSPSHTLIEANIIDEQWVAFDPLLGIYYADLENGIFLNFEEIQETLESTLQKFAKNNYRDSIYYYKNNQSNIIPFTNVNGGINRARSFLLSQEQTLEYNFSDNLPWLARRNLNPPPKDTIGYIKYFQGNGKVFNINRTYPLNSVTVDFLSENTDLFVDNKKVNYNPNWKTTQLVRYVWFHKTANIEASKPIGVTTILQISGLPYYKFTDGFIRVNANEKEDIELTVEYYIN